MQYALSNGQRQQAVPGARGSCPDCGSDVLAKCGPRVVHHWAHAGRKDCDPWWENETDWHRQWKSLFPEECREISHVAPDGEIHRSDIKTTTGIYIEVQHSAMTDAERASREAFYGNLVWIVDGTPFKKAFELCHMLPDPNADFARDLVWYPAQKGAGGNFGTFWRKSENPDAGEGSRSMVLVHSYQKIEDEVLASFRGHQQYHWTRPRQTWLDAQCPVYVDFGDDYLLRLERYGDYGLRCIFRVAKKKFIHDVMTEARAVDIATRFYPIASPPAG